jgi:HSP20 family protein
MTLADRLLADLMGDDAELWSRLASSQSRSTSQGFVPPVDIYENEDEFVLELDAPGLNSENLSAEVVDGQLVIAGEREPVTDAQRFFRRERWSGRFVRTFQLGSGITGDSVSADYHNGVLMVKIPKPEETKPKRISIGTSGSRKQITK